MTFSYALYYQANESPCTPIKFNFEMNLETLIRRVIARHVGSPLQR